MALVHRELAHHQVHIAALSNTSISEQGQLGEVGVGDTRFCRGSSRADRRDASVVYAIRMYIVERLPCLPQDIIDQPTNLCLRFRRVKFATVLSVSASGMTPSDEAKEKFYADPHATLATVLKAEKLVVFDDFNAQVATRWVAWREMSGHCGGGGCIDDGLLLPKPAQNTAFSRQTFSPTFRRGIRRPGGISEHSADSYRTAFSSGGDVDGSC
ncbi:hypothetical protein SprV_0401655900 [Sparganum proliferum]